MFSALVEEHAGYEFFFKIAERQQKLPIAYERFSALPRDSKLDLKGPAQDVCRSGVDNVVVARARLETILALTQGLEDGLSGVDLFDALVSVGDLSRLPSAFEGGDRLWLPVDQPLVEARVQCPLGE